MRRSTFYFTLIVLMVVNGYLLSAPNMLGKIGLIIYRYYYLRTFPRTLLTVSVVCLIAVVIVEIINWCMKKEFIKRRIATGLFCALVLLGFVQLFKTGIDFSAWSYSHSGIRFRLGAFMLPTLLIFIFTYGWMKIPEPEVTEEMRWLEDSVPPKTLPKEEESHPAESAEH